nr:5'-nucleotidase [Clostridium beijerinckii]
MPYNLKDKLVIAISSRAIFDLEKENEMYEKEGLEKYSKFQVENEEKILEKGTAFHLYKHLLI